MPQSQGSDLADCEAAAELGLAVSFRELDWRYPGSQFILTVRDEAAWLTAWQASSEPSREEQSLRRQTYGQWRFDPQVWRQVYQTHVSDVMTYFWGREQDLLVFEPWAGDGWEKLCAFLQKPVPDRAFLKPCQEADPRR